MRASRLLALVGLALGALLTPSVVSAQAQANVPRIGVIHLTGHHQLMVEGLRQGLRDLGFEEGRNLVLEIRQTKGDAKTLEEAAGDLERSKVNLIYAVTTIVAIAAKRATTKTPIICFAGADPVAVGLVESLAKPGGRLTGVHSRSRDLTEKRMAVLKEMIPKLDRVVTLYSDNPIAIENARLGREAAQRFGVRFVERRVSSIEEVRAGLQALKPREMHAYFHTPDSLVTSQAQLIIEIARAKKLPTIFHEQGLAAQGALASYGSSYLEVGRMSARLAQRILSGTHPKDSPVENYDKVGLALNLRTARELGLTLPQSLLRRADIVIE